MKRSFDTKKLIIVSFFTALTAVGAFLKIPLPHVPITLQTFFVIMSGNILGHVYGTLSQILYIIIGLVGLPIFAYGGGPGYIFQPTFGYILGYPFCALTIGYLMKILMPVRKSNENSKIKRAFSVFLIDIVGIVVIFMFGLSYIYVNMKYGLYKNLIHTDQISNVNWKQILQTTFFLFIPIDLIKASLAAIITEKVKRIL